MPAYKNISDVVNSAVSKNTSVGRAVMLDEAAESEKTLQQVLDKMVGYLQVMKQADEKGSSPDMEGPLYNADAYKMKKAIQDGVLPNDLATRAVQKAIAVNGLNSLSGKVVATPTGGACGILPGVLLAAQEEWGYTDEQLAEAMFAAAGMGIPIAENGTLSGSVGGCQAECGSGAAMAAAALADLRGGTPQMVADAFCIACTASMGLICDPLGSVSCPCVKRNGMYAAVAISAAFMALSGIKSQVPHDQVLLSFCDVSLDVGKKFSKIKERVGLQKTEFAKSLNPKDFH